MRLTIEIEQEEDGRWLSEVPQIPGVMVYGNSQKEAILKVQSLALHVLADKLEQGETLINMDTFFSVVAA
jgi:predicted RNase H-like HicB family nuclease